MFNITYRDRIVCCVQVRAFVGCARRKQVRFYDRMMGQIRLRRYKWIGLSKLLRVKIVGAFSYKAVAVFGNVARPVFETIKTQFDVISENAYELRTC